MMNNVNNKQAFQLPSITFQIFTNSPINEDIWVIQICLHHMTIDYAKFCLLKLYIFKP